jgi:hypothetical protein
MLFRYSGEFAVPHETTWSESIDVMARFAAMVSTDPDFDLGPVTLDRVGFRAVPFGSSLTHSIGSTTTCSVASMRRVRCASRRGRLAGS